MRPPLVLCICGVRTNTAKLGWFDAACDWINNDTSADASQIRYSTWATTRFLQQGKTVRDVFRWLTDQRRSYFDVSIMAHSNGCQIVCEVLKDYGSIKFNQLHFFGAACDSDFRSNGLNDALLRQRVQKVNVYGSEADWAMRAARLSRLVTFGKWGYGGLGGTGPLFVDDRVKDRVFKDMRKGWGHSTWFDKDHFENTMHLVRSSLGLQYKPHLTESVAP